MAPSPRARRRSASSSLPPSGGGRGGGGGVWGGPAPGPSRRLPVAQHLGRGGTDRLHVLVTHGARGCLFLPVAASYLSSYTLQVPLDRGLWESSPPQSWKVPECEHSAATEGGKGHGAARAPAAQWPGLVGGSCVFYGRPCRSRRTRCFCRPFPVSDAILRPPRPRCCAFGAIRGRTGCPSPHPGTALSHR